MNIEPSIFPGSPSDHANWLAGRLKTVLSEPEPTKGLPDPNITGPCQLQASILCEPSAGRQRMDPMDMAKTETSFQGYVMCCQPCYDAQADEYIRVTHGRA